MSCRFFVLFWGDFFVSDKCKGCVEGGRDHFCFNSVNNTSETGQLLSKLDSFICHGALSGV